MLCANLLLRNGRSVFWFPARGDRLHRKCADSRDVQVQLQFVQLKWFLGTYDRLSRTIHLRWDDEEKRPSCGLLSEIQNEEVTTV
jgi:hypothetical protein